MAQGFKKFMGKGDSGAKKKERIRQEKKKVRQETKEYFEKKKQEAREARAQGQAGGFQSERARKDQGGRNTTNYQAQTAKSPKPKAASKGNEKAARPTPHAARNTGKPQRTGYKGNEATRQRGNEQGTKATSHKGTEKASSYKPQFEKKASSYKPQATSNTGKAESYKGNEATRQRGNEQGTKATRHKGIEKASSYKPQFEKKASSYKSQATSNTGKAESFKPKVQSNTGKVQKAGTQPQTTNNKPQTAKAGAQPQTTDNKPEIAVKGSMPLNKFIAHAGICSRRDAVEIVKAGKVVVNGTRILEPGHKVTNNDEIKVNGKTLHIRRNLVYILLNKPKDYITTTEDPQGRKTVLDIIRNATPERVYPIGRLDRNTTGVLLLTNDGELAQKLSHPSYEIRKIYEVKLDKPLVKKDFDTLVNGITLEDGFIAPDLLAYADPKDKSVIGIEIHSGRNRIVRRIFEHLGYDVRNLDRVMYANLTKKNVDRGKWRFLTEKEVRLLKYLNASYTTKNKTVARG